MLHYMNCCVSIAKVCKDFGDANGLTVYDFDAHATVSELPNADIIGPMEIEVENDEGMLTVMGMIGISLREDLNLFRLRPLVAKLFRDLSPNNTFGLYDAETSKKYGIMKILNGTQVLPVVRSKNRPIQFVAFAAATDQRMLTP